MITHIKGTLVHSTLLLAVVETGGIGYEVHIPLTTAEKLPRIGEAVNLHTLVVYREDSQTLFGFATAEDRDFFRVLVEKVSGIGPRTAQSMLSRLSSTALKSAIQNGDVALLSKCQGIGKKTAERVVLELKDKLGTGGSVGAPAISAPTSGSSESASGGRDQRHTDALAALMELGFKAPDADKAIRQAWEKAGESATTEVLVKTALQRG